MTDTTDGREDGASKSPMTEMQRAKALTELSKQMMMQYHERRNLEWRIHVLFWTLLAAGAYFIVTVGIDVEHWKWLALLLVTVVAAHMLWTVKMQLGETRDQNLSRRYREAALEVIFNGSPGSLKTDELDEEQSPMPKWLRRKLHGYWQWNFVIFGTTIAMATAIFLVVLAGYGHDRVATTQRLLDLEHRFEILQQNERITELQLEQTRADLEVLRQSSPLPHARPSGQQRP